MQSILFYILNLERMPHGGGVQREGVRETTVR